jgi:transcriptional regulator with XRE-family HTH domain
MKPKFLNAGVLLKNLREKKKLSQLELADKCGLIAQYVSNWERGQCLPPRHALKSLVAALRMTPAQRAKLLNLINADLVANNSERYKGVL